MSIRALEVKNTILSGVVISDSLFSRYKNIASPVKSEKISAAATPFFKASP
jgi:hypothetical protein